MASFVVARGQIEKGKDVIARKGGAYKPKNAAERDRLLAAGVIVETGGKGATPAPAAPNNPARDSNTSQDNGTGAEGAQFSAGDGGGAGTSGA